jgi:indolepyruvate ferredoxin oxidoreductase
LLLACDLLVAAGAATLSRIGKGITRAIVNTHEQPTSAFMQNPDLDLGAENMRAALKDALGTHAIDFVEANRLATRLLGDSIGSNLLMLGFAFQKGFVPLSLDALQRAIELNGVAVELNKHAFALGRLAAHRVSIVDEMLGTDAMPNIKPHGVDDLIADRVARLTQYQNTAYAQRFLRTVGAARSAAQSLRGGADFVQAVTRNLFKLMAYKDEYEVARLYTDRNFAQKLRQQFDGDFRIVLNLAPPLLARVDKLTGKPRKMQFGPWIFKAFKLLSMLRGVRGTRWDVFGYSDERRLERQLISEYEQLMLELCENLDATTLPIAIELAKLPEQIRGFGHVKVASIERTAQTRERLIGDFRALRLRLNVAA